MPGTGRRYILSMVGLRAAPKGVDKKSVGRSEDTRILDGSHNSPPRAYL